MHDQLLKSHHQLFDGGFFDLKRTNYENGKEKTRGEDEATFTSLFTKLH